MAKQGFNICIISRNEQKINSKIDEINAACKEANTGLETMSIVADFSKLLTIKDYQDTIANRLEGIDIGLLIANAGLMSFGPFAETRDWEVEEVFNVNATQVVYLIKVMVNQLINRYDANGLRSGIIITSSGLGSMPISGTITYSAAKSFASFMGEGLNYELKDKIDVMSYQAG